MRAVQQCALTPPGLVTGLPLSHSRSLRALVRGALDSPIVAIISGLTPHPPEQDSRHACCAVHRL